MLRPVWFVLSIVALIVMAACASDSVSDRSSQIQSCYHTGFAIKCIATPGGVGKSAVDVDGDGQPDSLVCADGVSDSDSDADDATLVFKNGDDDEADDADSDSASDSDCGPSTEDDDSDSISDADGDGDADGVGDDVDCGCQAQLPPTDGVKPPPIVVK